jgi:protein-S-isoprenylcysteine O-methyltransferase Ste14
VKTSGLPSKAIALVCYLTALAGAAALAARVLLLGAGLGRDAASSAGLSPWLIDLAWLTAFGLQHSVMAREGFKRRWTRVVPPHLERSVYAALSGLLLLGLALTWQTIPGPELWHGPRFLLALPLLAGGGLAAVNLRFDHAGLFGLRQAWHADRPAPPERLLVVGPYRYVRHPLMACLLAFLWMQPVMPATLALLSGGLTAYVAVGVFLEERDLSHRFYPLYDAYRRRVPALVPWRRPASPADFAPTNPEAAP